MDRQAFQVAILYNLDDGISRGDPHDLLAIQYTVHTTQYLYDALNAQGYQTVKIAVQDSLEELVHKLSAFSPENTFIFDNCDGFNGNNLAAVRVIRLVEELGFLHTGINADGIKLCTDKSHTKQRLVDYGIPTPSYQVFHHPMGEITLDYPLIIKPIAEDASMGIGLNSVVTQPVALYEGIQRIIMKYEQPALVEEFIPGRELAVAMWGNGQVEILPIAEQDYSFIDDPLQRLLTFEAKWEPESFYYKNIISRCPAPLSSDEEMRIHQVAVDTYRALGLRDFGRVDVRYDNDVPYVIDVNELPDLSPESGFWISARSAGYQYPEMVESILQHALKREGWV